MTCTWATPAAQRRLGAAVGGLDLKIVASFGNFVQTDLVVRPDIKTAADLKGKRIGVTSIGGTGWMSAMLGLEQIGLSPERDKISLAAFGDQTSHQPGAGIGNDPRRAPSREFLADKLKRAGFNFLGDVEKIPLVGTSVVVKSDYLASHQATRAQRFAGAAWRATVLCSIRQIRRR